MWRFWNQVGVSCVSALTVAGVFLWMHRAPPPVAEGSCLDQVIDDVEIDLSSLEAAMASLERATGLRFEVERLARRSQYDGEYRGESGNRLRLRGVTVGQAMRCIAEAFRPAADWAALGKVVRLGGRPAALGPQEVRAYDVRDLLVMDRAFEAEFVRITGIAQEPAPPPTAAGPGSFSGVPRWAEANQKPTTGVSGEAHGIRELIQGCIDCEDVTMHDAGGWLVVYGTAAQHEQVRTALWFLRSMR